MSETDGAKTGLASLVRRHPSFFFFRVGLSFFFFSYAAQWAPGVGVLPYALVYLGNAILILSGITFVYGRKKIGISPTSQPQLTVLFLTCWWTVTVTAISLGAGIPATFGREIFTTDFAALLFVPGVFLFQKYRNKWRPHPPTPYLPRPHSVTQSSRLQPSDMYVTELRKSLEW